ncbi:MAG: cation:proton antiporter [Candidatus Sungbacteria bacterium]|nr:cation:proton antiporter [Candidatus Sungbacteria bacterium]
MILLKKAYAFLWLSAGLVITFWLNTVSHPIFSFFEANPEGHLLVIFYTIALICVLSFVIFILSSGTPLPSFVVAILFGIVGRDLFAPVVDHRVALGAIVGFGATLILFGGGLETPWENFKKLLWKILSLSFAGLFITALLFSVIVAMLARFFGMEVSVTAAVLLGAVLASTDPAAIIPVLKTLRFHNRDTKDIVVSESAMTDVTGTLLTVVFLSLIGAGVTFATVGNAYGFLLSADTIRILVRQISYGVVLGTAGYVMLQLLSRMIQKRGEEFETDAAYFLFVPIIIFTIALAFGGSGYLAAFVAGLLFVLSENMHVTAKFFNQMIDGFFKPAIFLLLGALVDPSSLVTYAGLGIAASLVFMFVIRPLAVFLTLGPFSFFGNNRFTVRELLFVSFVRETGAIPAVLLVTIVGLGMPDLNGLLPIGLWAILSTLVLQPALTPAVARFLGVASIIPHRERPERKTTGILQPPLFSGF